MPSLFLVPKLHLGTEALSSKLRFVGHGETSVLDAKHSFEDNDIPKCNPPRRAGIGNEEACSLGKRPALG